jgi:ornithine--oxo-acid transaminase
MRSREYIDLEEHYSARNYKPADVVVVRGRNVWVWDVDGNRYLDCVSGYGAVNQGHCNPTIQKALVEQSQKLTLISRAFRTDLLGLFSKELCEITDSDRVLLMNSGAEAVETALKTVRKWGYTHKDIPEDEAEIIVCENNFHGRTIAVIGFSTMEKCRAGFGPFAPGFKIIPFNNAEALEEAITPKTVGFMVEPIQGEGGINTPDPGYLQSARDICTRNNIALIFDEIQTGLGRTGALLAEEHENIRADMSIIGKSLGGGYMPVSAVLSRGGMLDVLQPGDHGSTFGGNPLACAVGRAALSVTAEQGLVDNAREKGAYLKAELEKLKLSALKQINGWGLMMGLEVDKDVESSIDACIKNGLLCNKAGKAVVRFAPPLTISQAEADWALERLETVFSG